MLGLLSLHAKLTEFLCKDLHDIIRFGIGVKCTISYINLVIFYEDLRLSSTPIAAPTVKPNKNAEPILCSCFLFEIYMDALPRCLSPSNNEDASRKDDSSSQKRCPDDSISSNSVCESPVEILIPATASFSIEIEKARMVPASASQSSEDIKSTFAASLSASPRVLIATSCDLNSVTAELEITFSSSSIDDDDNASQEDDSDLEDDEDEEIDDDGANGDEDLLDCPAEKEDSAEAEEEDEETCLFSVLDILNGSGVGRQRRISEQSFESVDWSESDNDDSQVGS